ncbi:MAG: hypothetical protein PHN19_04100, partial [Patescibacteria group bacterium]|nr:hypothetical protein [Patescibacteria group bacterium]
MKKMFLKVLLFVLLTCSMFCFGKIGFASDWVKLDTPGIFENEIILGADGYIYAPSNDKIFKYSNNNWSIVAAAGGYYSTYVSDMALGIDGSFYIASNEKVWKYFNNSWSEITVENLGVGCMFGYFINSLVQAADGSIYAGGYCETNDAFVSKIWKFSAGVWTDTLTHGSSGKYGGFTSFFKATDNSIYAIGRYDIKRLSLGSNSWINIEWPSIFVDTLTQGQDGSIYVGGSSYNNYARVYRYSNNEWSDTSLALSGESTISSLVELDGVLYANGQEKVAGGYISNKIWKYIDGSWSEDATLNTKSDYYFDDTKMLVGIDGLYASIEYEGIWKRNFTAQEKTTQQQQNLESGEKITLESALNEQTISGQDLTINFTKLPTKLTKNSAYWMKWNKSSSYPNKTFLKKWKLKTNLYKYKVKKSSQKYKIKVSFKFTKKQLKKYLKKNKSATKSNLFLKYKKGTGTWQNINTTFTDAKIIKKDKKFIIKYFTKYPVKIQYFAIG